MAFLFPIAKRGSSPQMRGALCSVLPVLPFPGIIPADAGGTTTGGAGGPPTRDHPRRCGEHAA